MGGVVDPDTVKPTQIEHKCDEIFDGDTLQQKYNYFVYHFERDGRYFWARTYVEDIDTVSIYGPFDGRETMKPISGSPDDAILAYLKRRFEKIDTLGPEGYVTIWSR
jgi:hypothetical protein